MNKIEFYEDLLSMYDESTLIYISVFSKVEYVIQQVFSDYHNSPSININYMKYSIIKAILVYRPVKVIETMYKNHDKFVRELRDFFRERIILNKVNIKLKKRENEAFDQILLLLKEVSSITSLNWDYWAAFNGFAKLLQEMNISEYELIIDEEGDLHSTANAAECEGIINVREENSSEYVGIRMADMLIGLVSRIMQSLNSSMTGDYDNGKVVKTLLEPGWFILNDRQLGLYKKLYRITCENGKNRHNTYSGVYSDDLVAFVSLLRYMSQFRNVKELQKEGYNKLQESFNSSACGALQNRFDVLKV